MSGTANIVVYMSGAVALPELLRCRSSITCRVSFTCFYFVKAFAPPVHVHRVVDHFKRFFL